MLRPPIKQCTHQVYRPDSGLVICKHHCLCLTAKLCNYLLVLYKQAKTNKCRLGFEKAVNSSFVKLSIRTLCKPAEVCLQAESDWKQPRSSEARLALRAGNRKGRATSIFPANADIKSCFTQILKHDKNLTM